MARKRRKSRFPFLPLETLAPFHDISEAVNNTIRDYYTENIHITRSIDEQLCKMSVKWCALPQERRYDLIHTGLGVKWLFDLAENDQFK